MGSMQTADDILDLSDRLVPPPDTGQRLFRIALVAAVLLHAALFIEVARSVPRAIGNPSGVTDAIAVDLVTEADLRSRETVALPPAGAPAPPPAPPAPRTAPEPAPPVKEAAPAKPPEPAAKEAAEKTTEPKEANERSAALPGLDAAQPDLATVPQPADPAPEPPRPEAKEAPVKPAEKQPPPQKKKPAPQVRLDPSPRDFRNASPGRSAAASRPPGITRSGENDEFGRAVIRALRQTMPPPRGIFGRVTVRLILNQNGDLSEVRVLEGSGTSLDRSVVFATRQTYFPLPPYNATVADRTFLITYVYR